MEIIEAVILGISQGIFEWLPVSSEGIGSLIMVNFFGKNLAEAVKIAIWLHLGTLLAAIVYFREDIMKIVRSIPKYSIKKREHDLTTFIIITTMITGLVGGIIFIYIDKISIDGKLATALIGALLIITGIMQKLAKKSNLKKTINIQDSFLVGLLQGLSILPGISRSGMTSSMLLLHKYSAEDALRISFLLSIPAVFIALIGLLFLSGITFSINSLIAVLLSFILGLITIKFLLKLAAKIDFSYFCFFLGIMSFLPILL